MVLLCSRTNWVNTCRIWKTIKKQHTSFHSSIFAKLPHNTPYLVALHGLLPCAKGRLRPVAHRNHRHSAQNTPSRAAVWRMIEMVQVSGITGAGQHLFWRRCPMFLAQVGFLGWDLRQHNAQNRDSRRRSPTFFLTCAKTPIHLHQQSAPPAPMIGTT